MLLVQLYVVDRALDHANIVVAPDVQMAVVQLVKDVLVLVLMVAMDV